MRLLAKLSVNPINIPLRRFAFATRHCPPSKGRLVLPKESVEMWSSGPINIPLRCFAFEGGIPDVSALPEFISQRALVCV